MHRSHRALVILLLIPACVVAEEEKPQEKDYAGHVAALRERLPAAFTIRGI